MCGISGLLEFSRGRSADELRRNAWKMAEALRHRGPDHGGVWTDEKAGIALSMRRLAILDLSPAGEQPMHSASGRYTVVYNGEIYNYSELKRQLEADASGPVFRGSSDTEVMLAAMEAWGMEEAVRRFNGMFAFAVWDCRDRVLTLGRDRFGEKPLYYANTGTSFLFGSELKALRTHPDFNTEVDRQAAALFFGHGCVPAPYSIYRNCKKLPPATLLRVSAENLGVPQPYWSLEDVVRSGIANPIRKTEGEAIDELDSVLRKAVGCRMHADVPLGAFLSGGIDSSIVVALMQAQSSRKVRTFSIGSFDKEFDEAKDAAKVARHLGTEHTELYVSADEAMNVIPRLAQIYDEPFADSSQIPTYLVSQLARRYVTVSLSGDGGDEFFGGYERHIWGESLNKRLHAMPLLLRRAGAAGIRSVSPKQWDFLFNALTAAAPPRWKQRMPGYKLHKLASLAESDDRVTLYNKLASRWIAMQETVQPMADSEALLYHQNYLELTHTAEEMMYLDACEYLPNDILVKLDRATMAVSLEGRVPFLDPHVVEFAWRLPLSMRVRGRQGKWILRQLLYRYVPRELVDRPKSGFGIPLATWLRGPLRDWTEALLDEGRVRREGYLHADTVAQMWKQHLSGKMSWEYHLWDVLMFQAWLDESREVTVQSASCMEMTGRT